VSQTSCNRCGSPMGDAFVTCPHCGALQDEQSRAAGRRRKRTVFLVAISTGLFGAWVGWQLSRSPEWIPGGGILGFFGGWGVCGHLHDILHDRTKRHPRQPPHTDEAESSE
jgi:hypothetical protein